MNTGDPAPEITPYEVREDVFRLFREGVIDEDAATAYLLAVDLAERAGRPLLRPATGGPTARRTQAA